MGATSVVDRITIAVYNATTAFADPTRADAVAALGDITAPVTLRRIHDRMMADPTGRRILEERPVVSKATIPYEQLVAGAPKTINENSTFGQVYGSFLKEHGFDPDERDKVHYVQDEALAYIMLRYRQVRILLDRTLSLRQEFVDWICARFSHANACFRQQITSH